MKKIGLKQILRNKSFGEILFDEPMKNHTSFRIGGPCDAMIIPDSEGDIIEAIKFCRNNNIKYLIMGNGTNLLVKDKGIEGIVIKIANGFDDIVIDGTNIICQAGSLLSQIAQRALDYSLTGFEFANGIPGTIGGAITMNAGAYGGEMKDVVNRVRVLDRDNNIMELGIEEMKFGYRNSIVTEEELVVLSIELNLEKGEPKEIQGRMEDLTKRRESKQPLNVPNGGSTFKRPKGYYAGKLIEDAGLRGTRFGDAQVSEKHCGFIINRGNATASEILDLIGTVQKVVNDRFNVKLKPEIKIVGRD